jgi:manganese efflux pump family protein
VADGAGVLAALLPLSLDTFAAAAALAALGGRRLRTSVVLAAFEGGMPIVGALAGGALGAAGETAELAAIGVLAATGVAMLVRGEDAEEERLRRFAAAGGPALLALGVAVSVDELAVGFSLGLLGAPLAAAAALLAAQAFLAAELGMRVGARLRAAQRERVERVAALALLAIAAILLVERLAG